MQTSARIARGNATDAAVLLELAVDADPNKALTHLHDAEEALQKALDYTRTARRELVTAVSGD